MDFTMKLELLNKAKAAKESLMEVRKNTLCLTRKFCGNGSYYPLKGDLCPAAQCLLDAAIAAQDKHLLDAYRMACLSAGIDQDALE